MAAAPQGDHRAKSATPQGDTPTDRRVVLLSYQQVKEATARRSNLSDATPPSVAAQHRPSDEYWVPNVKQVASPPSHFLSSSPSPANHSGGEHVDGPQVALLQRELESRRTAMTRMESENLTLLREMTQWKLAEEERIRVMLMEHDGEVRALREKLHRAVAVEQEREGSQRRDATNADSKRSNETILLLQRKLEARDAEVASLTQRVISADEQIRVLRDGSLSGTEILAGRVDGLQALVEKKDAQLHEDARTIDVLRTQVQDKTREVMRLNREAEVHRERLVSMSEEGSAKDRKIESASSTIEELRRRMKKIADDAAQREADVLAIEVNNQNAMQTADDALRIANRDAENVRLRLRSTEGMLADVQQQRQNLETELASLKSAAPQLQSVLHAKDLELAEASALAEDLRISLHDARQRLRSVEEEAAKQASYNADLVSAAEKSRDEFQLRHESVVIRVKALEEQLEASKAAYVRMQRDLAAEQALSAELQHRVDDQSAKLSQERDLLAQVDHLRFDVSRKDHTISESQQQYQEAIRRIAHLERDIERDTNARAQLVAKNDACNDEIANLERDILSLREHFTATATLESRIIEAENATRSKHEELQVLTVAYEELRHHTLQLQNELTQVPRLEDALRQALHDKSEALHQFEHAQVTLLSEREALARLSSSYESTAKQLRENEDDLALCSAELAGARSLGHDLSDAKRQYAALQTELASLRAELHQTEIASETLRSDKEALHKQLHSEQLVSEELRSQLHRLQVQLAETQTSLGRMEVHDRDLVKTNERLKIEHEHATSQLADGSREVTVLKEEAAKQDAALQEALSKSRTLQDQLVVLKDEASSTRKQLDEARSLLQSVTSRLAAAEEEKGTMELRCGNFGALEAKIRAQQSVIEGKTRDLDAIQRECSEWREKAATGERSGAVRKTLEESIEQLRRAYHEANDERIRVTGESDEVARKLTNCETTVATQGREIKRLLDVVNQEQSRCEAAMQEVYNLERSLKAKATVEGKLQALQGINEELREQLTKVRQQLSELQSREKQESSAQDSLRELQFEWRQVRVHLEAKDSTIHELEGEIEKKTAQIQMLRREAQTKDASVAQLQELVQESKRELQRIARERDALLETANASMSSDAEASQRRQIDEVRQQNAHTDAEANLKAAADRIDALSLKLKQQDESMVQLRSQIRDGEVSKAKVQMDLDIAQVTLRDLKDALDRAQSDAMASRQAAARESADAHERDRALVHLQVKHSKELQARDDDVNMLAKMIDELKQFAHHQHQAASALNDDQHISMQEVHVLEAANGALRHDVASLQEELRGLRNRVAESERRPNERVSVDSSRAHLEAAELHLADEKRRHRLLQEEHDQLLASVEAVKTAFAQREAALVRDVKDLQRSLRVLTDEKEQLRATLRRMGSSPKNSQ